MSAKVRSPLLLLLLLFISLLPSKLELRQPSNQPTSTRPAATRSTESRPPEVRVRPPLAFTLFLSSSSSSFSLASCFLLLALGGRIIFTLTVVGSRAHTHISFNYITHKQLASFAFLLLLLLQLPPLPLPLPILWLQVLCANSSLRFVLAEIQIYDRTIGEFRSLTRSLLLSLNHECFVRACSLCFTIRSICLSRA